jgi:hypothetical protein
MSRRRRAASGATPSTCKLPLFGVIRSATTRRKVDLPQPDGPSRVRNSPSRMSRLTSCNAVTLRRSVKKRTVTSRQLTEKPVGAAPAERVGALLAACAPCVPGSSNVEVVMVVR